MVGVPELQFQMSLYPNPTDDLLNLDFQSNVIGTIQILNILGEKMKEIRVSGRSTKLDLSKLVVGQYVVAVMQREKPIAYARFIKN